MRLFDAHAHYHFEALAPVLASLLTVARGVGLQGAVVNGTSEEDWDAVARTVGENPYCLAAYGIHPWKASDRSPAWKSRMEQQLEQDPSASVGEIGLDSACRHADLADQTELFRQQWELARKWNRPATVHCVKAWEQLRTVLGSMDPLPQGFLIHAYNGPPDWIDWFSGKGAYFSFSPYFLWDRKQPQREAFLRMPGDRILIETDAPDLAPPADDNRWPIADSTSGKILNHPANLVASLESLAATLGIEPEKAARLTEENWKRLFVI